MDEIDLMDQTAEMKKAERIEKVRRKAEEMPKGEPGVCLECGEESPRLVQGRCAFCRDGRDRHQ